MPIIATSFTPQTNIQFSTGTPETVCNDATALAPIGAIAKYNGNTYRYVKHSILNAVASAAAGMSYWSVLTPASSDGVGVYTVTADVSASLAPVNGGAGIFKGVVTTAYFTWVQIGGTSLIQTAASVVTGDKVYGHATTDLILTRNAVATATPDVPYGIALESVSNTVTNQTLCLLLNMAWG